jgi:hypothetical protein
MDIYLFIFVLVIMLLFLWLTSKKGANCFEHLCCFNGVESSVFIPFLDSLLIICYFIFIVSILYILASCKSSSDSTKPKGPTTSHTSLAWSATHYKGVTKVWEVALGLGNMVRNMPKGKRFILLLFQSSFLFTLIPHSLVDIRRRRKRITLVLVPTH